MWWRWHSIKCIRGKYCAEIHTTSSLGSGLTDRVIAYFEWLWCRKRLKGPVLDQQRANLERRPRSGLHSRNRPLLRIICGFRVSDDLPGRSGAADVGGPAAGAPQEAKAAAAQQEKQTWGQTANLGLQLNIVQDSQTGTGLWGSDGIRREPIQVVSPVTQTEYPLNVFADFYNKQMWKNCMQIE